MLFLYQILLELLDDVKIIESFEQILFELFEEIVGVGGTGFTVTTIGSDGVWDVQPFPLVTITVKFPVFLIVMYWPVSPEIATPLIYHWLPELLDDANVTLSPTQNVVSPFGVIIGVIGVS